MSYDPAQFCSVQVQEALRDTFRPCGEKADQHCPYGDTCLIDAARWRLDDYKHACPYRCHHKFTPGTPKEAQP